MAELKPGPVCLVAMFHVKPQPLGWRANLCYAMRMSRAQAPDVSSGADMPAGNGWCGASRSRREGH